VGEPIDAEKERMEAIYVLAHLLKEPEDPDRSMLDMADRFRVSHRAWVKGSSDASCTKRGKASLRQLEHSYSVRRDEAKLTLCVKPEPSRGNVEDVVRTSVGDVRNVFPEGVRDEEASVQQPISRLPRVGEPGR
jgi:hypothetical protein